MDVSQGEGGAVDVRLEEAMLALAESRRALEAAAAAVGLAEVAVRNAQLDRDFEAARALNNVISWYAAPVSVPDVVPPEWLAENRGASTSDVEGGEDTA